MKRNSLIRIVHDINFKRKKIKRGTLFKEFLNELFFSESFFLSEFELHISLRKILTGNLPEPRQTRKQLSNRDKTRYYLCFKVRSSDTVSFFLPFLLREANTRRPLAVAILSRNPCLFFLFLFEG